MRFNVPTVGAVYDGSLLANSGRLQSLLNKDLLVFKVRLIAEVIGLAHRLAYDSFPTMRNYRT